MSLFLLLAGLSVSHATPTVNADRPGQAMPDRHWDMQHLDLDVKLFIPDGRLEGQATHRVTRLAGSQAWLRLNQVALEFAEVKVNDKAIDNYRLTETSIEIPMPSSGDEHTVQLTWTAAPQTGLHFRGRKGSSDDILEVWSQGEAEDNRHWFPGWDYPNDKFTLSTTVTVPDGLHAAAPGIQMESESAEKGWTTFRYELDQPIVNYLVTVAAGEYQVVSDDGPVPFEYIGSRTLDPVALKRSLSMAKEQMTFFNELLGTPYPYPIYRQVLVQRFIYGAMENPSVTILADGFYLEDENTRWLRTDNVVAHELVHQWFGDLITCYGWRELWLNEGFANYYAAKWQESQLGDDFGAAKFHSIHQAGVGIQGPMAARSWSKRGDRDNEGVYVRGASVLYFLRSYLGEEVFNAAIKRYVRENANRLVESEDLRRVFEDETGLHLGWVFDQWVYGQGTPKLKSSHKWSNGTLTVSIKQENTDGLFTVPFTVEIGTDSGTIYRKMWIEDATASLAVELAQPPLWVAVDPDGAAIAKWDRNQTEQEWIAQLNHSAHFRARIHAMLALGDLKATDEAVAALEATLREPDRHPKYRAFAARSLGKLASVAATEHLLDALNDPNNHIREAAARALGEGLGPDTVVKALKKQHQTDPALWVRTAALDALAKLQPEEAANLAKARLKRPDGSFEGEEHLAALYTLGRVGSEKDIRFISSFLAPSQEKGVRTAAASAVRDLLSALDSVPKDHAALKPLAAMLEDQNIRARSTAISTLAKVGNQESAAALRAFAAHNQVDDPNLSEIALDAATAIRIRLATPSSSTPKENVDLKRLEEKIEALEGRLERMEQWR